MTNRDIRAASFGQASVLADDLKVHPRAAAVEDELPGGADPTTRSLTRCDPQYAGDRARAEEIEDQMTYYDSRDLCPLLVRAGFRPSRIRVYKHKFRLNTFAVCRADKES